MGNITIKELLELPIKLTPVLNVPTGYGPWTVEKQEVVIDEIFKGFIVGGFTWKDEYTIVDVNSYHLYTSIHDFIGGKFTLHGVKYEELTDVQKNVFLEYKLSYLQDNRSLDERKKAIMKHYNL
ncbi:hypothetical protein [Bacillus sp. FJAT-28004]|uniref:hypothetical protein n=1 Tax=Bacillus sp. FJAT-28004 TaxID=1679165 RepID=UPI0006B6196E|nr:hypothetical protein [Bacillus sp. FJAT-28004]